MWRTRLGFCPAPKECALRWLPGEVRDSSKPSQRFLSDLAQKNLEKKTWKARQQTPHCGSRSKVVTGSVYTLFWFVLYTVTGTSDIDLTQYPSSIEYQIRCFKNGNFHPPLQVVATCRRIRSMWHLSGPCWWTLTSFKRSDFCLLLLEVIWHL